MPGPGAHLLYALSAGVALSRLAGPRRFGPHHCAVYAVNAFLGPDLGSFAEWLASFLPSAAGAGDLAMAVVHHPFYYPLLLGIPLACLYAWLSRRLLRAGLLDAPSGVALSRRQCFLLITAGSLSHFFLDHLFEENGHSTMYTWILSTGWWKGRAPINLDAVMHRCFPNHATNLDITVNNTALRVYVKEPKATSAAKSYALLRRWHKIETTPTITTVMRHPSIVISNGDKPLPAKKQESRNQSTDWIIYDWFGFGSESDVNGVSYRSQAQ
ncbi:hypothetical protein E2562_002828 [Oryza meyeriana var. granulata]|uniref:Uncharacterized protein n=1 Tax=Oryza meyeriana var. granulata TaxID=110450 RepID=A0A6G1BQY1_9ORYZ|nr:hypothetical protein E2562_002828 [Oryza meyeriana var. granulata]